MSDKREHEAYLRMMRRLKRNVRDFRRAMHLTVKAAAARAHVHWRYWQKIEAGEVNATIAKITQIANALGVDPRHLLLHLASTERAKLIREAMRHAAKTGKRRDR
jgi:transcriptional regulator with XRE-family HTH domain